VLEEGERVPLITFRFQGVSGNQAGQTKLQSYSWAKKVQSESGKQDVTHSTKDLFAGKRTLVFHDRLFTPSDFLPYLPQYEKMYEAIRNSGIDEVYCASNNDGQVMRQWFISQGCEEDLEPGSLGFKKVKPLPGGNLLFRKGRVSSWSNLNGALVASARFGRSAAIIQDMEVEKLFTESTGEQASAENVLHYLQESLNFSRSLIPPVKRSESFFAQFNSTGSYALPTMS